MKEYIHFDGENDRVFDLVSLDKENKNVLIATTNCGKITVSEYAIKTDKYGDYFEYGHFFDKIYIKDFLEITEII